jgi:two-component system response regulator VicR
MKKVLVAEDEQAIREFVVINLRRSGYEVTEACDGAQALEEYEAENGDFDVAVLDIMMPNVDGLEVCKQLRAKNGNIGIILLTARTQEMDKVSGLMMGADDYITKPFSMRELIARIKANIRRTDFADATRDVPSDVQTFGNLEIDMNRFEVRKSGQALELTQREFELLKYLAAAEGRVFSREQLLEEVWGYEYYGDIRTVDVTVRRLREKLEDDSSDPKYIMTKRGIGYYFRRP